jgi:hypothetical protein
MSGVRVGSNANGRYTDEANVACIWMFSNVVRQVTTGHPFRDELERSRSDTEERNDVLVFQTFPNYSFLVEGLRVSSATTERETTR